MSDERKSRKFSDEKCGYFGYINSPESRFLKDFSQEIGMFSPNELKEISAFSYKIIIRLIVRSNLSARQARRRHFSIDLYIKSKKSGFSIPLEVFEQPIDKKQRLLTVSD